MAKRDTRRTAHRARQAYEWAADQMPDKDVKKHKAKERQLGKKESKETTAFYEIDDSWYCGKCAVEVYQTRCKYCGKSSDEES